MPRSNILPMATKPQNALDAEILRYADSIGALFHELAAEALRRIHEDEAKCLERLNDYVPTNRPLTVEEAATYLGMTKRALNDGTRPGKAPVVPYLVLNGKKLFRKSELDRELERREIKKPEVRL